MYNGNGYKSRTTTVAGRSIPTLYLYIGIGALVLLGIWLLSSVFKPGIDGYFALITGVLLVLGNLRDLIANPYAQRSNIALLNTMLGGGLIFFWLGKGAFPPIGALWYIPAVLLMLLAAPLMIGRASVYARYLQVANTMVSSVKRVLGGVTRVN